MVAMARYKCTVGPLLLVAIAFSTVSCSTEEGVALLDMMKQWQVTFPTWTPGSDPCDGWEHVLCTNGRVTTLNLGKTGISGTLPKEIGQLSALDTLDVSENFLHDHLPDELEFCQDLRYLDIKDNSWDIEFPTVIMKLPKLEYLYASNAALKGTIPKEFYNMKNLKYLFLGNNTQLTGNLEDFTLLTSLVNLTVWAMQWEKYELPTTLSLMSNLKYFNCHDCNLVGALPESYGDLPNLVDLNLRRNELTGGIPESWKKLTKMFSFRVDNNFLLGPFPNWVFTLWPNLTYLYLSRNQFYGIPYNISYLETTFNITNRFQVLRWDCNYITGPQPCSDRGNNICSQTSVTYTQSPNAPEVARFSFDPNCYSDVNSTDYLQRVSYCVGHTHTCDSFSNQVLTQKICPVCPQGQQPIPGSNVDEGCRCELRKDSGSGFSVGTIVGIVVGVTIFFLVLIVFLVYYKRKEFSFLDIFTKKREDFDANWEAPPGVRRFSVEDLAKITSNFDENHIIGIGGFGKVYSGTLEDGRMVAIKRASADGLQGHGEFRNEVSLLSRLHHRHLVKLEGFCYENDFQVLVYEFMPKGNLAEHLYGDRDKDGDMKMKESSFTPLPWFKRLEIAYGVALGLEYLHSFATPPVIHRDVKPSNILLDENMVAKVADFGISKVFGNETDNMATHLSTRPAGTAGYLDPEYFLRRQLSTASDVYGYGVVLLELITGQIAIDHMREDEYNLVEWVKKRFRAAGIVSVVDPRLGDDYSREALTQMTDLALRCASFSKNDRPTMKDVIAELDLLMPKTTKTSSNGAISLVENEWLLAKKELYHKYDITSSSTDNTLPSMNSDLAVMTSMDMSQDFGPR